MEGGKEDLKDGATWNRDAVVNCDYNFDAIVASMKKFGV